MNSTNQFVDEGALFVTRALAYARTATRDEHEAAATWYDDARSLADIRARVTRVSLTDSARVLAILSPRAQWQANTVAHAAVLRAFYTGSTMPQGLRVLSSSVVLAWQYLHGRPWDSLYTDAPKVYAFAPAILGDTNEVVVDTIVARALAGRTVRVKRARYERMANAVRIAARQCDMTPRELQALIWIVERGGAS